jgi:hypothetical protein
MSERGYPAGHDDQVHADLSVGHSGTLDRYRAVEEISHRAAAGTACTEDLPHAMIDYRALFGDLLGQAPHAGSGSGAAGTSEQFTEPDPKEIAT